MSTIYDSVEQLVGNTPLLRLSRLASDHGWKGDVLAKLEYLNPAGSAKDRLALTLIDDAEARGELTPGGAIIEPTSGNTGIGLAMVAAARGYRVIPRGRGDAGGGQKGGGASFLHPRQLHAPAV